MEFERILLNFGALSGAKSMLNLVDLVKTFQYPFFEQNLYSNEYLLAHIGVDTVENEHLKVPGYMKANLHV